MLTRPQTNGRPVLDLRSAERTLREARRVSWALVHRDHPLLAQIIPMRRCNLACAYCNEYDRTSDPVPTSTMLRRVDRLAALRTAIVTVSGGEPMMHPDLDDIVRRIRDRGMIAGLITNGFYLGPERIRRLNDAGLDHLQISIDNVAPDEVSKKSLRTLDKKLEHLAAHARFHVNINTVVGAGMRRPDDARTIARRAAALGFSTSVGILHDETGRLLPLSDEERAVYDEVTGLGAGLYTRVNRFQKNLIAGLPNDWQCRAGARYLYVCEDGLVHYCSQQRGRPGIPLEQYTTDDIRREFDSPKDCAPYCTIGCVHRASVADGWRRPLPILRLLARGLSRTVASRPERSVDRHVGTGAQPLPPTTTEGGQAPRSERDAQQVMDAPGRAAS